MAGALKRLLLEIEPKEKPETTKVKFRLSFNGWVVSRILALIFTLISESVLTFCEVLARLAGKWTCLSKLSILRLRNIARLAC